MLDMPLLKSTRMCVTNQLNEERATRPQILCKKGDKKGYVHLRDKQKGPMIKFFWFHVPLGYVWQQLLDVRVPVSTVSYVFI